MSSVGRRRSTGDVYVRPHRSSAVVSDTTVSRSVKGHPQQTERAQKKTTSHNKSTRRALNQSGDVSKRRRPGRRGSTSDFKFSPYSPMMFDSNSRGTNERRRSAPQPLRREYLPSPTRVSRSPTPDQCNVVPDDDRPVLRTGFGLAEKQASGEDHKVLQKVQHGEACVGQDGVDLAATPSGSTSVCNSDREIDRLSPPSAACGVMKEDSQDALVPCVEHGDRYDFSCSNSGRVDAHHPSELHEMTELAPEDGVHVPVEAHGRGSATKKAARPPLVGANVKIATESRSEECGAQLVSSQDQPLVSGEDIPGEKLVNEAAMLIPASRHAVNGTDPSDNYSAVTTSPAGVSEGVIHEQEIDHRANSLRDAPLVKPAVSEDKRGILQATIGGVQDADEVFTGGFQVKEAAVADVDLASMTSRCEEQGTGEHDCHDNAAANDVLSHDALSADNNAAAEMERPYKSCSPLSSPGIGDDGVGFRTNGDELSDDGIDVGDDTEGGDKDDRSDVGTASDSDTRNLNYQLRLDSPRAVFAEVATNDTGMDAQGISAIAPAFDAVPCVDHLGSVEGQARCDGQACCDVNAHTSTNNASSDLVPDASPVVDEDGQGHIPFSDSADSESVEMDEAVTKDTCGEGVVIHVIADDAHQERRFIAGSNAEEDGTAVPTSGTYPIGSSVEDGGFDQVTPCAEVPEEACTLGNMPNMCDESWNKNAFALGEIKNPVETDETHEEDDKHGSGVALGGSFEPRITDGGDADVRFSISGGDNNQNVLEEENSAHIGEEHLVPKLPDEKEDQIAGEDAQKANGPERVSHCLIPEKQPLLRHDVASDNVAFAEADGVVCVDDDCSSERSRESIKNNTSASGYLGKETDNSENPSCSDGPSNALMGIVDDASPEADIDPHYHEADDKLRLESEVSNTSPFATKETRPVDRAESADRLDDTTRIDSAVCTKTYATEAALGSVITAGAGSSTSVPPDRMEAASSFAGDVILESTSKGPRDTIVAASPDQHSNQDSKAGSNCASDPGSASVPNSAGTSASISTTRHADATLPNDPVCVVHDGSRKPPVSSGAPMHGNHVAMAPHSTTKSDGILSTEAVGTNNDVVSRGREQQRLGKAETSCGCIVM